MKTVAPFDRPFAFYRVPGEEGVQLAWGRSAPLITDLEGLEADSFVLAPFRFFEDGKVWAFTVQDKREMSLSEFGQMFSLPGKLTASWDSDPISDTPRYVFESSVKEAVDAISGGRFLKTALSRVKNMELPAGYDWADWFVKACKTYPSAMVFFVHLPGVTTWAGATPELFLSSDGNSVRSVSLAGTLHDDSEFGWRDKEAREQSLVTDFITSAFLEAGFHGLKRGEPEIMPLGRLSHIKTTFEAPAAGKTSADFLRLVKAMHPTPAVGGMPRKEGLEFLISSEKHDRRFYSGFLGPWNIDRTFDLFVNLRSMEVFRECACLFAGAGITVESRPEEEWSETENKLKMNIGLLM